MVLSKYSLVIQIFLWAFSGQSVVEASLKFINIIHSEFTLYSQRLGDGQNSSALPI